MFARVALALGLAACSAAAGAQPVYRCDDGKGGVLYADTPCQGGTKVDLLPGRADPAAIERMKREERAFAERQAMREARAAQEAAALRESRLARREWQAEAAPLVAPAWGDPSPYYWGGVWPGYPVAPIPPVPPPRPPFPPRPLPPPYVPATPGLGVPSPPPAQPRPERPAPPPGKPVAGKPLPAPSPPAPPATGR